MNCSTRIRCVATAAARSARFSNRHSVGLEAALSFNLGLIFDASFRLGYAHGFGPGGEDVVYLLLGP